MENNTTCTQSILGTQVEANCLPCQPVIHDWENAFCGCKQCKRCNKREYGFNCSGYSWTWTNPGIIYPTPVC